MGNQTRYEVVAAGIGLLAGLVLTGCPGKTDGDGLAPTPPPSPLPLTAEQTKIREQLKANGAAKGETDFAFQLLQKVAAEKPTENAFLSAFSVSQAVLLAANGTTGAPQQGFLKAIGLPSVPIDAVNAEKKEQLSLLEPVWQKSNNGKQEAAYEWTVANAIWSRYAPKKDYVAECARFYNAQAQPLTDAATINQWADEKTRGRISEIVDDQTVSSADLILTNAVYFKGKWEDPFEKTDTHDAPFHLAGGTTRTYPLMHRSSHSMLWYKGKGYEAVSLPYKGGMSMIVILPNVDTPPQKLLVSFSSDEWDKLRKGLRGCYIELALPTFEIGYKAGLMKSLTALGMPTGGDFSVIADQLTKAKITDVVQKTFLRVDEEGTEAAAVTGMSMTTAMAPPLEEPHPFIVDRPFLCAIVHDDTGTTLFWGIINDPEPPKK